MASKLFAFARATIGFCVFGKLLKFGQVKYVLLYEIIVVNEKTRNKLFFLCFLVSWKCWKSSRLALVSILLQKEEQNLMRLLPILYHQLVFHIEK